MNSKNRSTAVFIAPADGSELLPDEGVLYCKKGSICVSYFNKGRGRGRSYPGVLGRLLRFVTFSVRRAILRPGKGRLKDNRLGYTSRSFTNFRRVESKYWSTFGNQLLKNDSMLVKCRFLGGGGILLESMRLFLPNSNRYCEFAIWHFCEGGHETLLQLRRPINMELERRE